MKGYPTSGSMMMGVADVGADVFCFGADPQPKPAPVAQRPVIVAPRKAPGYGPLTPYVPASGWVLPPVALVGAKILGASWLVAGGAALGAGVLAWALAKRIHQTAFAVPGFTG